MSGIKRNEEGPGPIRFQDKKETIPYGLKIYGREKAHGMPPLTPSLINIDRVS